MKDTKDNKTEEQHEKVNFQSFRKHMSYGDCCTNYRKCDFDLLYDEFVRIWRTNTKLSIQ